MFAAVRGPAAAVPRTMKHPRWRSHPSGAQRTGARILPVPRRTRHHDAHSRLGPSVSRRTSLVLAVVVLHACDAPPAQRPAGPSEVRADVEAAVWAFHAADTARDAEGVIALLWPEYQMLVDGRRLTYEQVVQGSREFMGDLTLFHTEWTDLRVTPIGADAALASFLFRDSILTRSGELIRNRGPTTFLWVRRGDEWRILYGDSDHYPIEP